MEKQQKLLQDFHVKFDLERTNVGDDEDDEARASKHSEFVELKKRLEEEEKIYAGHALSEVSEIDQIEIDPSTITFRNHTTIQSPAENINSSEPAHVVERVTMDGVINSFGDIAISKDNSSPQDDMKLLPQPQNTTYVMKGHVHDNDSLSDNKNCCQKTGKEILDEGDKSDIYMTNSSYSVLNVVCPVSKIPVVELDDPVRSEECEHIYDRASALNYIASMEKYGFCLCASQGCHALLAENKLVVDDRLWRDIEELRQIKATMWENRMLQDYMNMDDSDDD